MLLEKGFYHQCLLGKFSKIDGSKKDASDQLEEGAFFVTLNSTSVNMRPLEGPEIF